MNNLIFYNKEGDYLNFNYNESLGRYEGDIIFHENSNDTFKTQALYMFQNIPKFEYENISNLDIRKFQLFNERGFHFYNATHINQRVTLIQPVNNDSTYFSKWIFGRDFNQNFPIGTLIKFDNSLFEFVNANQSYFVIAVKKDAILIISLLDNKSFNNNFNWQDFDYSNITISSANVIGVYDYIDSNLDETLSDWNEPDFYDRLYIDRKLNIVNSFNNDSFMENRNLLDVNVVTIKNNLVDILHYRYSCDSLSVGNNFWVEVNLKKDLPIIYSGNLNIFDTVNVLDINGNLYENVIQFSVEVPNILKPGVEFKIENSSLNSQFLRVANISEFVGNSNLIFYNEGQQTIWNNRIYQCIQGHTWSADSLINPNDSEFWILSNYIPVVGSLSFETLTSADVYLTTDKFIFKQEFIETPTITKATSVEKFRGDLSFLGIDYYFEEGVVIADLVYPTKYADIKFIGASGSNLTQIGKEESVYERLIEVKESLNREFNYDWSRNFSYNIIFNDLDRFGLTITINGQVYDMDIKFIFSSGVIDMERTIDATLKAWVNRWSVNLLSLGIITTLQTLGVVSQYSNSINLSTEYPNVELDFLVQVGTTANFLIEKSTLVFYDPSFQGLTGSIGNFIDIRINGRSYSLEKSPNITMTEFVSNWISEYVDVLDDFGVFVSQLSTSINFFVKDIKTPFNLDVRVGASSLPGDYNFKIIDRMPGNMGAIITSNEIILGSFSNVPGDESFIQAGFSTGMIVGINGTIYPLQDIDYNILYLSEESINLSYEGPFWGSTSSICSKSPFKIIAFSQGFTQSVCDQIPTFTGGGEFSDDFNSDFNLISVSTTYDFFNYPGFDNMVDLVFVPSVNQFFVLCDPGILVIEAASGTFVNSINLTGNVDPIKIIYNHLDGNVWAISINIVWIINTFTLSIQQSFNVLDDIYDISFNLNNGDIYITTDSSILVYNGLSLIQTILQPDCRYLTFNDFEGDMYVTNPSNDLVFRISGSSRNIINSYSVVGLTTDPGVYDPANESIYVWSNSNLVKIKGNSVINLSTTSGQFNNIIFNSINSSVNYSTDSVSLGSVGVFSDDVIFDTTPNVWGYQALNLYDSAVYVSSQNPNLSGVWVYDSLTGQFQVDYVVPLANPTTKLAYNPIRKSVWILQPSLNNIIEAVPTLLSQFQPISLTFSEVGDNLFGSLDSNFERRDYLWLNTRDFIRYPRENLMGDPKVSLYWKWFSDNVPEFFLYDFSGDMLSTVGSLSYKGPKPLTEINLNRSANRDIDRVTLPQYQQTIFPIILRDLSYIDDSDDISTVPTPYQVFIGYNSQLEGGLRSILQLYKKEDIDFTINTMIDNSNIITFETIVGDGVKRGSIKLDINSTLNFLSDELGNSRGFKLGQHLAIFVKDVSNKRNQYLSENNGYLVKISGIFFKEIVVDFFKEVDHFRNESTFIQDYPNLGNQTFLSVRFKIWDKEIGRFNVYGQTEIEDIRFKTELGNVGKLVSSDDVYIFKEYDIKEEGIDWTYLNKKRKEMLMMKHLIYPYIGSYKSIINAINYFGYNDLELCEYYRNVNFDSDNYLKLSKVEVSDIFNNSVEGWKEVDNLLDTFPNPNYEETNLFNLTYRITDKEGNNVLTYTLDEVQTKLQGLKYWLQKNIIPISHKIMDITGRSDFSGLTTINHIVRDVNIIKVNQSFTPVSFKMNELYLMPVNNGSTVYNCVLDFYLGDNGYSPNPGVKSNLPDNYTIDIRTYQIYREWYPFKNYQIGDRVLFSNRLWESVIDNNKTNNPSKYSSVSDWSPDVVYNESDIVRYDRLYYVFTGFGNLPSGNPVVDVQNWSDITEWKEIDLLPIQRITERRRIDNMNPYNFTIDSNIDPYVVIEVTSDDGYSIYRDKKNYEVRGILDIRELESFSNLTSKSYTDLFIPIVP